VSGDTPCGAKHARTLEDDAEGALADLLADAVVGADDAVRRRARRVRVRVGRRDDVWGRHCGRVAGGWWRSVRREWWMRRGRRRRYRPPSRRAGTRGVVGMGGGRPASVDFAAKRRARDAAPGFLPVSHPHSVRTAEVLQSSPFHCITSYDKPTRLAK
jgi:hypothetical protein